MEKAEPEKLVLERAGYFPSIPQRLSGLTGAFGCKYLILCWGIYTNDSISSRKEMQNPLQQENSKIEKAPVPSVALLLRIKNPTTFEEIFLPSKTLECFAEQKN